MLTQGCAARQPSLPSATSCWTSSAGCCRTLTTRPCRPTSACMYCPATVLSNAAGGHAADGQVSLPLPLPGLKWHLMQLWRLSSRTVPACGSPPVVAVQLPPGQERRPEAQPGGAAPQPEPEQPPPQAQPGAEPHAPQAQRQQPHAAPEPARHPGQLLPGPWHPWAQPLGAGSSCCRCCSCRCVPLAELLQAVDVSVTVGVLATARMCEAPCMPIGPMHPQVMCNPCASMAWLDPGLHGGHRPCQTQLHAAGGAKAEPAQDRRGRLLAAWGSDAPLSSLAEGAQPAEEARGAYARARAARWAAPEQALVWACSCAVHCAVHDNLWASLVHACLAASKFRLQLYFGPQVQDWRPGA